MAEESGPQVAEWPDWPRKEREVRCRRCLRLSFLAEDSGPRVAEWPNWPRKEGEVRSTGRGRQGVGEGTPSNRESLEEDGIGGR